MRSKALVIGLVLALVGGVAIWALAQTGEEKASSVAAQALRERPLARLFLANLGRLMTLRAELDLSSEQKAEIKQILQSHRSEIVALAKVAVEKKRALRSTMVAEPTDEAAIRAAARDLSGVIGDACVLGSKVRGEVKKVLTSDQIALIEKFRAESDASVDKALQKAIAE